MHANNEFPVQVNAVCTDVQYSPCSGYIGTGIIVVGTVDVGDGVGSFVGMVFGGIVVGAVVVGDGVGSFVGMLVGGKVAIAGAGVEAGIGVEPR